MKTSITSDLVSFPFTILEPSNANGEPSSKKMISNSVFPLLILSTACAVIPKPTAASLLVSALTGPEPEEVNAITLFESLSKYSKAAYSPHSLMSDKRNMYPVEDDFGEGIEIKSLNSGFNKSW